MDSQEKNAFEEFIKKSPRFADLDSWGEEDFDHIKFVGEIIAQYLAPRKPRNFKPSRKNIKLVADAMQLACFLKDTNEESPLYADYVFPMIMYTALKTQKEGSAEEITGEALKTYKILALMFSFGFSFRGFYDLSCDKAEKNQRAKRKPKKKNKD